MDNRFFERPILNSPYEYPARYWELDKLGQPTQQIVETRRKAEFITPIPKPRKRKAAAAQQQIVFDDAGKRSEKRAAIFIGPEFGTVSRPDLVEAAREAGDAGFDVLIACAFNYDARSAEFDKLGRIPVLKARMNADLHMADDLKNTGKGNLFVIFGEPDIDIQPAANGQIQVKINGVDVSIPTPARSSATAPTASPAGSSTPTTTRRASSSATPISWARTTHTKRSRPR